MGLRDLVRWGDDRSAADRDQGHPLATMQREMNDLFEAFSRSWMSSWGGSAEPEGAFGAQGPRLDVHETEKTVEVRAELPGLSEKDVDVALSPAGDVLILHGEKRTDWNEARGGTVRRERSFGSFTRRVTLPAAVQLDAAEATFDRGVLAVSLPKQARSGQTPRKIPIKIG
jgi:HSP20 family protein